MLREVSKIRDYCLGKIDNFAIDGRIIGSVISYLF